MRGDEARAKVPAVNGFQIYSGDGSLHWMKRFMTRIGATKLLPVSAWMVAMSQIGRNRLVVMTGSAGCNL